MRAPGYVYVLHFDSPLHHAQHYIGCTHDPRRRFIAHAAGRSARIMRAVKDAGIGFRVAALGQTHTTGLRRIERQVKDWHNASDFCAYCHELPRQIPGTRAYPLEHCPFPLDSESLLRLDPGEPHVEIRRTGPDDLCRLAIPVKNLMRSEKDALGFIPAGGVQGLTGSIEFGRMVITLVNGELGGYTAFTVSDLVKIHQCVTHDSYRRCGYGRRMVDVVRELFPGRALQAKVRNDLAANDFWMTVGFKRVGADTHDTSGSQLNVYQWFPL